MKVKSRIIVPKIKIVIRIIYNKIINRQMIIKKAKQNVKMIDITDQK